MTFLINASMEHIGIGTAGIIAILGYLVVFLGLVLLMIAVMIMSKVMEASRKKASAKAVAVSAAAPVAAVAAAPAPEQKTAHGTAGRVKLFDVAPKDAAMIMAIVADKMGKPMNELRFKSIKEVK
ncbi:MAG: OadG family transporter subunit [Oscillospiraceae bacterium]|nr:OadG family transporter subunit [Oscillospiraceae bacterium]